MHQASYDYVEAALKRLRLNPADKLVAEFGSYDVNGSVRPLFDGAAEYHGVDKRSGPGVDVEADAGRWGKDDHFDVVVSTSCIEHSAHPATVVKNAFRILKPGGVLILTTVGAPWGRHSDDGTAFNPDTDTYTDLTPELVEQMVEDAGFDVRYQLTTEAGDICITGKKRGSADGDKDDAAETTDDK